MKTRYIATLVIALLAPTPILAQQLVDIGGGRKLEMLRTRFRSNNCVPTVFGIIFFSSFFSVNRAQSLIT